MQDDNETEKSIDSTSNGNQDQSLPVGGDIYHPDSAESTSSTPVPATKIEEPETRPSPMPEEQKRELLGVQPKPPKKKSKVGFILLILLLLIALGGAGYWFTRDNNANNANQKTTVKETQDIELLKIGTGEGPAGVYFPDEALSSLQNIVDHQIYEGLVGLEDAKIVPLIAESWTNPDDKTWVFKIRPNLKFHTNKPVAAKEVKASLDSLSKYDYWSLFTSTIASTEVTGELEVTIKTNEPDALLLNRLVKAIISDLSEDSKPGNNGTGAYQVDITAKNDDKNVTLTAFDSYYRGHVKTRKLNYIVYGSDAEIAEAMIKKEIDIAQTLPFPEIKAKLDPLKLKTIEVESPGTFGLYMNHIRSSTTILNNKDFRTAVALAMNRQSLIEQTGNKNTASTQVIPKGLPGYDASLAFPAFDLTAAKAALAKSGYKGQALEFVFVKDIQVDPPILIKQLEAVGINIKIKEYASEEIDAALKEVQAGNFDFFTAGFTSDISDARDILGALLGTKESSYPVYSNADYDKLLADSDKTFDPTERIKTLQLANKYIQENVAWIPLRNGVYIFYLNKDIDAKNEFNGTGNLGAYYWKVGRIVP